MSLVPRWSGTPNSAPLSEFLEAVETAARIGRWSEQDKVEIATLKLSDAAKSFYNTNRHSHRQEVKWETFKSALLTRFRDVRTARYHHAQLHQAKQKRDESPQSFADGCRGLAQKIIPQPDDPVKQEMYNERAEEALLAAFTSGLTGTPGRQVRFSLPTCMEDAIRIAVTVHQAEEQERRNNSYLETEAKGQNSFRGREALRRKTGQTSEKRGSHSRQVDGENTQYFECRGV